MLPYSGNKAGMQNVNVSEVEKIVYETCKGSSFFKKQKRKLDNLNKRLNDSKKLNHFEIKNSHIGEEPSRKLIASIEKSRRLDRLFIHVDMDMFYAAVAIRDNEELKGKPVAVGTTAMIATASYEARKFGVRSGMPGFLAKKLCKDLIIVKTDFKAYHKASDAVREIFREYDTEFVSVGLDEAYMDLTEYCLKKQIPIASSGEKIASEIRERIFRRTKLTASAGIACNRILAKISCEKNKPNGQFFVPFDAGCIRKFLSPLAARKIPGVGRVTEKILEHHGFKTCGDLIKNSRKLYLCFKPDTSRFLLEAALGACNSKGEKKQKEKNPLQNSMSTERFFKATDNKTVLAKRCKEIVEILHQRFSDKKLLAKTVTIKIKNSDFDEKVRSKTLPNFISSADEIYKVALELLSAELPLKIRSIGVKLSTLKRRNEAHIKSFFSDETKNQKDIWDDRHKGRDKGRDSNKLKNKTHNKVKKREKKPTKERKKKIKQMTLKGFRENKNFFCPKCTLSFYGYTSINMHLDKCL